MNLQQRIEKMQTMALAKNTDEQVKAIETHELIRLESNKKEEVKRRQEQYQQFKQSIPSLYRGKTFDDFEIKYPAQVKIKHIANRFVKTADERLQGGNNLILHGTSGTGKTMLSLIICQALVEQGYQAKYESSLQFLRLLRDKNFESYNVFDSHLKALTSIPFLVLDEVTESRVTGSELTKWEKEMLFAVIDARYQQQKVCTIVISNKTQNQLSEALGERIFGRLSQSGITLAFNWQPYR